MPAKLERLAEAAGTLLGEQLRQVDYSIRAFMVAGRDWLEWREAGRFAAGA